MSGQCHFQYKPLKLQCLKRNNEGQFGDKMVQVMFFLLKDQKKESKKNLPLRNNPLV